jgi:hypothetical protein
VPLAYPRFRFPAFWKKALVSSKGIVPSDNSIFPTYYDIASIITRKYTRRGFTTAQQIVVPVRV